MHYYIQRNCFQSILYQLKRYPVLALLGSRQVGKSTLAKKILFEIKLNSAPKVSKGFFQLTKEIEPESAFVIAPVKTPFTMKEIHYSCLDNFIKRAEFKK